jgi:hypothetical protein
VNRYNDLPRLFEEHFGTAESPHPESYCHRCGGPNVSWSAPSPLWNEVVRGGDINGPEQWDGIICPTCFGLLAERAGIATLFWFEATDVKVPLRLTTPSGRVWSPNARLWVEP